MKSVRLLLYSTLGCHLCTEAKALVQAAGGDVSSRLQEVDIVDDPILFDRYAVRIPVLVRTDTGAELGWPFDSSALDQFLACIDSGQDPAP